MVFGTFVALETYIGFLLDFIPYWHWIRLAFFIWLLLPAFNGADILYAHVMRPILADNKDKIKELIKQTQTVATYATLNAAKSAANIAANPENHSNILIRLA